MKQVGFTHNRISSGRDARSLNRHSLTMRHFLHRVVATILLVLVSTGAWAARNAKVTTSVTPTGSGFAYISTSNTIGTSTSETLSGNSGANVTFYIKAVPLPGYTFARWEIVSAEANATITNTALAETTISAQCHTTNNQTRNYTIRAVFEEVEGFVGLVFYSGGTNGNYLNNSTSGTTSFDPKTCIWTGTSGGKFTNGNYYLRNNSTVINNNSGNASNCAIEGAESGTTGAQISLSNGGNYYLRYNSGWTRSNSTSQTGGRTVAFAVIKQTGSEVSTAPTITTADATFTATGSSKTYVHSVAAYTMGYNDYIFYNGAHHYWKSDDSEAITGNTQPTAETFTYTWSLSASAAGHVTVDVSTGVVSYNTYYDEDTQVTLTLTATSTNKTFTANKTITFEAPKTDPTGITATIDKSTIYVGETGQVSYTLQGTPCYDNVTFSSSNTSVATVNANTGVVTAIGVGTATITATAHHYTTEGTDKTATVTVTVKNKVATPVISFEPSLTDGGETATATITCATEGATISYSVDGGATWTAYTTGFTVNNLDEVKAKAVKAGDCWDDSDVATATYSKHKVATPTITINNGKVSFSCDEEGDVTYYYTTDGNTPTTGSTQYTVPFTPTLDECTIKVIATKAGAQNSDVAERLYVVQSGTSDSKVILNDYEDHNWTYYAGVDASVDGGHYNRAYLGKLYSPNPRNVKITYNGVNNVTNSTTVVKVSTKTGEGQNSFIYYKTLEQGATTGEYPYQVISNPFSVRPSTGSGTSKVYYGFNGWKIVSGGEYIKNHNNDDVLSLDEEITFVNLKNKDGGDYTPNCTSAEIVFETTWSPANVQRGGANVSNSAFNGGDYEHNFCVINAAYANALAPTYPVTITSAEPDGSATYNVSFSNLVTPVAGAANTTKLEYISWAPSNNIDACGRNLTIGRGVTTTGTARQFYGTNQTAGATNVIDQVLKIESGTYSYFRHFTSSGTNRIRKQIVVFGCDYDRAKSDNAKLSITGRMIGAEGSGAANENGTHDANLFMSKTYMKSGTFMEGVDLAGAGYQNSYYLSINSASNATGKRLFEMEGGYLANSIAGGMDVDMNGTKNSNQYINVFIRIRGGHVLGCIYGAARKALSQGSRQIVLTGGEVNGWIAGGANGDESADGSTAGASYIYVGGNAKVGGEGSGTSIGSSIGGCVYGAGCGYGPNSSSGQMELGTNVVVADNAYVERGVYGGGAFGYCKTDETANIYITGGHVEGKSGNYKDRANNTTSGIIGGVFGGARMRYGGSANIYMTGGQVDTGVYGGSNYTGTLEGDVKMVITGGQVGKDATHTGNIHGGGYGQPTLVNGDVDVTLGTRDELTGETSGDAVIYGDVYGGSALGQVNATGTVNNNTLSNVQYKSGKKTNVTLNAGTINGSLYGGALGNNTVAANVYGPVAVKVYGGSVRKTDENGANGSGAVYGANNINGAPQRAVTVDIYGTDPAPAEGEYALFSVYGGGNAANYTYGNGYPKVTVHNCDNSIEYVYGGGNAAAVAATDVTIYGGDKIGNVFGGGNGQVKAANVTGGTNVKIYGGTIGDVYGGSNTNGTIGGTISVNVNATAESGKSACPIDIDNVYGGGNKAASAAGNITIGCAEHIGAVYGGANQANVTGDINLKIESGHIDNVFGGNNNSGTINGKIVVTIEDKENTCGMEVGNVYAGGNKAPYSTPSGKDHPVVNIKKGSVTGDVFGGGLGSTAVISGNPIVNINGGTVAGRAFGGGSAASVTGNTTVNVISGSVKDVFGGGLGAATNVSGNVVVNIQGGTVTEDVYGGSALGSVNTSASNTTQVNLTGGTVTRDVYGGGLGDADNAAIENGKITVTLGQASTTVDSGTGTSTTTGNSTAVGGSIFGANNVNGTPKDDVNVIVNWTTPVTGSASDAYHVAAVYGGGNKAAYIPANANNHSTHVTVNHCENSIEYVYGGGNAAPVPSTVVLIKAGEIGNVFGGGNGAGTGNPGANVGVTTDGNTVYGTGNTLTTLCGGTIGGAFGGSNTLGNIKGTATLVIDEESEEGDPDCPLVLGEAYGGANKAYMDGTTVLDIRCISSMPAIYGGSKEADINSNIVLTINSGTYGQVFGGNNLGGKVKGSITVNIEETGCHPVIIGEVYGCGNQAAYDVNWQSTETKVDPVVNVVSCTKIGRVFGGGYGAKAVVTGNPTVNINMIPGEYAKRIDADGNGEADNNETQLGVIGEVFGGGNAADVVGQTNVNIGTVEEVVLQSVLLPDKSNLTAATKTVQGANINAVPQFQPITGGASYSGSGNVYGGGNQADVTGKSRVQIGPSK